VDDSLINSCHILTVSTLGVNVTFSYFHAYSFFTFFLEVHTIPAKQFRRVLTSKEEFFVFFPKINFYFSEEK